MNSSTSISRLRDPFQSIRRINPATVFGIIIGAALLFFEMFNYSTTNFALRDLLGDMKFASIYWSTILSIAFCAIDFAGIARLFMPEQGAEEPKEVWYLFGAWLLAATMNAVLTWWGVSMAIVNHTVQSVTIINPLTLLRIVPVFVAFMVWVIRILIIGTISIGGERLFWRGTTRRRSSTRRTSSSNQRSKSSYRRPTTSAIKRGAVARSASPAPYSRRAITEPEYHSLSMGADFGNDRSPQENYEVSPRR